MHAKVSSYDLINLSKHKYELKDVCLKSGHKNSALIEVIENSTLDCMGRMVDLTDFCLKNVKKNNLIRTFVENDLLSCEFADKVHFAYICEHKDHHNLCLQRKKSCENFKNTFAKKLNLEQSYLTKVKDNHIELNCVYVTQEYLNPAKILPSL